LIKTLFHALFLQENIETPARVGLELFLSDLVQKKNKNFRGNETKSEAGHGKQPIIYSISSPLGLFHAQVKKSLLLHNFPASEASSALNSSS